MSLLPLRHFPRPRVLGRAGLLAVVLAGAQFRPAVLAESTVVLPRHWTFLAAARHTGVGAVVAGAGDVNGDGHPDVLAGVPGFVNAGRRVGGILLFTGSPNGLSRNPLSSIAGRWKDSRFGESVSGVGDVDGDGFGEVLAGVPASVLARADEAAALLYAGSAAGLNPAPAGRFQFRSPRRVLGSRVGPAGDVNGDGFADVLVCAPGSPVEEGGGGAAWLLYGSATGLVRQAAWTPQEDAATEHFGGIVAGVGDVNGDGFDDVVVGASMFTADRTNAGRACLHLGSRDGLSRKADQIVSGAEAYGRFGGAVARLGDVNRDGFADVAIGAAGRGRERPQLGKVFVYLGSSHGLRSSPGWTASAETLGSSFGRVIAGAGDVNGDGCADLLVGATEQRHTATNEGRVLLYLGSTDGLHARPCLVIDGGSPHARFGAALAGVGDVNRDGLDDFLIGSPHFRSGDGVASGRLDLFYGSREAYGQPVHLVARGNSFEPFAPPTVAESAAMAAAPRPAAGLASVSRSTGGGNRWAWGLAALAFAAGGVCALWLWRLRAVTLARERARIARDLHDEIGARLTRLSLLGGTDLPGDAAVRVEGLQAEQVARDARDAMAAMREIVWRVDPANDTLEKLASFLGQRAQEMFAETGVRCFLDLPALLPDRTVPAEVRHHVFLAVREALHNALRHARARTVWLRLHYHDPDLVITVEDDGRGLPADVDRPSGNGLRHMRDRMAEIDGTFALEPRATGGTHVTLRVTL